MTINWNGKRRWIAGLLLLAGILVMVNIPPVIPVIQLPGEKYPGSGWNLFGLQMTNSLMGSVIVWILLALLIFYVMRKKPKDGSEVPPGGFYNLFEMTFEGLYGFVGGVAGGPFLGRIFKMFMTIFLIVLLSNWIELVPGVDSIGFLEAHVNKTTGAPLDGYETMQSGGIYVLNPKCKWISPEAAANLSAEAMKGRADAGCVTGTGAAVSAPAGEVAHETTSAATEATPIAEATAVTSEAAPAAEATAVEGETVAAEGATTEAAAEGGEGEHHYAPGDPSVPWVVLPYLRAPSTDLNLTVALALIAVIMIQVTGFSALGAGYLTKFFNFKTLFTSPLGGIDVAVGLLELIGEFAKILSFAFRLLGNIFAGSILLFVMSFLLPFLPWPFFILEFFVGALQAFVFGLLTAIFMNLATASHGHEDHEEEHAGEPVETLHAAG